MLSSWMKWSDAGIFFYLVLHNQILPLGVYSFKVSWYYDVSPIIFLELPLEWFSNIPVTFYDILFCTSQMFKILQFIILYGT